MDSVWSQIFYHVWWPGQGNDPMYLINQQMNRDRNNYYGNNYTPHLYSNGRDSGSNPATWRDDARNITNEISLFTLIRVNKDISFVMFLASSRQVAGFEPESLPFEYKCGV